MILVALASEVQACSCRRDTWVFPSTGMTGPTNAMLLTTQSVPNAKLVDTAGRETLLRGHAHGALRSLDLPAPLLLAPNTDYTLLGVTFRIGPGTDTTAPRWVADPAPVVEASSAVRPTSGGGCSTGRDQATLAVTGRDDQTAAADLFVALWLDRPATGEPDGWARLERGEVRIGARGYCSRMWLSLPTAAGDHTLTLMLADGAWNVSDPRVVTLRMTP